MRNVILAALVWGGLAGCASPRLQPTAPVPTQFPSVADRSSAAEVTESRWWQRFHNPVLDQLIGEADANNRDVRAALARAEQARAGLQAATADLLPGVQAVGKSEQDTTGYSSAIRQQLHNVRASQLGLQASWEIVPVGRARSARRAARADPAS